LNFIFPLAILLTFINEVSVQSYVLQHLMNA
jgi:hypothetical protein